MLDCEVPSKLDPRPELGPHPVEFVPDAPLRLGELLNDCTESGGLPLKEEDDGFQLAPAQQSELDRLAHSAGVAPWSSGRQPRLPRR